MTVAHVWHDVWLSLHCTVLYWTMRHTVTGCALMNPRKKMLHALRDLGEQLHEQEQQHKQQQEQLQKSEKEEGRKQSDAAATAPAAAPAAAAAAAAVSGTDNVEEGIPSSAGAPAADRDRDRQMQALQAENSRLRQKVETMRQLLGVDATPMLGDS